jgi:hypothetical protein
MDRQAPIPTTTASASGGGAASWVFAAGAFTPAWAANYPWSAVVNVTDTMGGPLDGPVDIAVTVTSSYGAIQPATNPNPAISLSGLSYFCFAFRPTQTPQSLVPQPRRCRLPLGRGGLVCQHHARCGSVDCVHCASLRVRHHHCGRRFCHPGDTPVEDRLLRASNIAHHRTSRTLQPGHLGFGTWRLLASSAARAKLACESSGSLCR